MKVCLIASNSIDVSPYVKKYALLLDNMGIKYDIISKEPSKRKNEDFAPNNKVFFYTEGYSLIKKFRRFWDYACFVNKILKKNKYEKAVIFSVCNSCFSYLRSFNILKNKCKYIVDIRDYDSNLKYKWMKTLFTKAIKNAEALVISSEKFKSWIPKKEQTYVMHNIPQTGIKIENTNSFKNDSIVVGYLGGIGYYNENVAIAESVKNSKKISLLYAGIYPENNNIRDYCEKNDIKNVKFFGRYDDKKKADIYKNVDIINAVYGNDSLIVTTALPNKLYDSIFYKIPVMACSKTFLGEIVEKYSLGFCVEPKEDDIRKKIIEYSNNFNESEFKKGCNEYLNFVLKEQEETERFLNNFLEEENI